MLSVKGDGVASVGGNTGYGDPNVPDEPFGPIFSEAGAGGDANEKRQIEIVGTPEPPYPILNTTGSPGIRLGPGPVRFEMPNLFNPTHTPSDFARTLFSLFREGRTERANLRLLGSDVPSPASPAPLNSTDWITSPRPLGEEVIIDGFDMQLPSDWKGTYQDEQFHN